MSLHWLLALAAGIWRSWLTGAPRERSLIAYDPSRLDARRRAVSTGLIPASPDTLALASLDQIVAGHQLGESV